MKIDENQDLDYDVVRITNIGFVDPYGNASNAEISELLNHEEDVISAAEKLLSYVTEG